MKRILSLGAAMLGLACQVYAGPQSELIEVKTGTNDTGSSSIRLNGYVDEIVLDLPAGTAVTGTVTVTSVSAYGAAVTLATKAIAADATIRPRLDGTDNTGSALTSDPPGRYMAAKETLTATVSSANTTGLTWRVLIKYDDTK